MWKVPEATIAQLLYVVVILLMSDSVCKVGSWSLWSLKNITKFSIDQLGSFACLGDTGPFRVGWGGLGAFIEFVRWGGFGACIQFGMGRSTQPLSDRIGSYVQIFSKTSVYCC